MKLPVLFHIQKKDIANPVLLRVIVSEQSTRLDFGYTTPWYYSKGGWIKISPATYLTVQGSDKKYTLIDVEGIAIAPKRLNFQSTEDWKFFSLFFETLPTHDCIFNMIESENPTEDDFNFYNISLSFSDAIPFRIE